MSPIIVFAFNRKDALENTIQALLRNEEAKESDLFVFVDGPRHYKAGEEAKVQAVRDYVKSIAGFRSVTCSISEVNKGLGPSIISGVTQVIDRFGTAIVVEDDLVVSRSFIRFMNEMLERYENDSRVMQVSGFGCKLTKPSDYKWDVYLNERGHSWTWGTWKDRWETVDWEVKDFEQLKANKKLQRAFCKRGSDLYKMLKGYMEGKNKSWYIRFNYSMYKQHRYAVCPIRSLVRNEGFTSEATNCNAYNRYKIDFEEYHEGNFMVPEGKLIPVEQIMRDAVKYWTIRYRIYGKLMTYLYKLKG